MTNPNQTLYLDSRWRMIPSFPLRYPESSADPIRIYKTEILLENGFLRKRPAFGPPAWRGAFLETVADRVMHYDESDRPP